MCACRESYRIGLVGLFKPDPLLLGWIDALADRFHDSGESVCIIIGLQSPTNIEIAEHILTLKRILKDIRLEVVVTRRHWEIFERGCKSELGQQRNDVIRRADDCRYIEGAEPHPYLREIQFAIESQVDQVIYTSKQNLHRLSAGFQRLNLPERSVVQALSYPPAERVQSARLLYQSIAFIHEKRFRIPAEELPPRLLAAWLADDRTNYEPYFGLLENPADLLRLTDCKGRFLPLKVFAYVYTIHNDLWAFGHVCTKTAKRRFYQFQTLLRRLRVAQGAGKGWELVDIFDFGSYDQLLRKT